MKPGFFTNEDLAELSFAHRLCFAGLWTLADREGRLEDRPRRIKAAIFPYDDVDIEALLNGLSGSGFIVRYVADGVACLAIPTFERHQRPKTDEHPSALPPPLLEDPRRKESEPRSYKGDIGTLGQRTEGSGADAALAADGAVLPIEAADGAGAQRRAEDFASLWNELTKPPIARCRDLTSKRRRHVKARMTERAWDEWAAVFCRIQRSRFCRGESDRGWVASFDWVIGSPDVAVKVLEGKYDDRAYRQPSPRAFTGTPFECPHQPRCGGRNDCHIKRTLEAARKPA